MLSHRNSRAAASIALAVLFAGGAGLSKANATVFQCDNGQRVNSSSYAIGLLPESLRERGRNELTGEAIVLIKPVGRTLKDFYPVNDIGGLGCQFYQDWQYRTKFVFRIPDGKPDQIAALKNHIRNARQGRLDWNAGRWDGRQPSVLLFRQSEQFKPFQQKFDVLSSNLAKDVAADYFGNHRPEAGFLAGFPGTVYVTFDTLDIALYQPGQRDAQVQSSPINPPTAAAPDQSDVLAQGPGATPASRPLSRAEEQKQRIEQQKAEAKAKTDAAAKAKADAAKARTDAAAAKKGPATQPQTLMTAAAPPAQKTVTLKFQQRAAWQELLAADPAIINTFGHCGAPEQKGDGAYSLNCSVGDDGKVAVRIRGFKTLMVGTNDPAPLEERLEVAEFSQPYPAAWKRPRGELITVSGPLRTVLARPIPLSQGIEQANCNATMGPLTVAQVVRENLPWPDAPCLPFVFAVPQGVASAEATVTNCLPDSATPIRMQNGVVNCWRRANAATFNMSANLTAGFGPVAFGVSHEHFARGRVDLPLDFILQQMRPLWPYAAGLIDRPDDGPAYAPRQLYFLHNNAACGRPHPLPAANPGENPVLPPPAEAGCMQVPTSMAIDLVQTGVRGDVPAAAFKQSHPDNVQFGAVAPGTKKVPVEELKLELPVAFTPADNDNYYNKFGPPAGNNASPGVYLFSGDCSNTAKNPNRFVAFRGRPGPKEKWPISGAVYDGKVDDPLTRCVKAVVNTDNAQQPFLTFQLEGARAVGPRRAIVISAGQKFIAGQGTQPALLAALEQFVDKVFEAKSRAALSPINVFLATGEGSYRELFNGEAAAFEPANVKQKIKTEKDNSAPATPDFTVLQYMPQLKEMERVTIVMDGSEVSQTNLGALSLWVNKYGEDNVALLISSGSCPAWKQHIPKLTCETLPAQFDGKRNLLVSAFDKFITRTTAEAAAPQPPDVPAATKKK